MNKIIPTADKVFYITLAISILTLIIIGGYILYLINIDLLFLVILYSFFILSFMGITSLDTKDSLITIILRAYFFLFILFLIIIDSYLLFPERIPIKW